ncbi:MAG: T9SS type A sorting domain-containing protein, partial [Bacteroidales bacterium]|nr:T9SS type A sorting domain-containing protein [Bacteroidales bacterium]
IHGNYTDINFQSNSVTLDKDAGKAIMPYGIRKDSLLWHATMGPNTGYTYDIGVDTMNSTVFRTGDTLNLFVAGNELIKEQYIVEVKPPAADMNLAFPPLMYRNYEVTEEAPGIDTIFNVGYATRTDTLLKYIEVAPNASVSFEWVDGVTRPDVKNGDIFKVTAENGLVKRYYIKVNDYVPNENVLLSQIYVNGDSIEVFAPNSYNYSVTLPMGTVNLPAIQPIPQDRRSTIVVTPPKLTGTSADRTAIITVTAENDTLSQQYFVTFNVAVEKPDFIGDPFISQFIRATAVAIEIYNPSSDFVDLSNYIYFNIQSGALTTYESIFTEEAIKNNLINYMRFGYYVDTTRHDGVFFLPTDKVDAFVEPGKTFGMLQDQPKWRDPSVYQKSQFISNRAEEYGFEDMSGMHQNQYNPGHPQVLLKIINDSIIAGTKSATDPNDFELIDLIGEFGNTTNFMFGEDSVQWANAGRREMIVRLPWVWRGNPNSSFSPEGDFGLEDESTLEWDYQSYENLGNNGKWVSFGYGEHFAEPVSVHLSTVTSKVYSVSDGYIQEQSIKGVLPQTSMETFYANLIKANKDQKFKLMSGGIEKSDADDILEGDKLIVTSADSVNVTTYVISLGALSSEAYLYSDVYSVDGLKIQGIVPGDLLSDVLANVYASPGATIDVLDDKGQVVPTSFLNADTMMVDMLANDNMVLVVTAEDKNTQRTYSFQFMRASDDAWVMSTYYTVIQGENVILGLLNGENVTNVLANLIIPRDATIKIVDKLGNERPFGTVAFDDKVVVTSASKAVSATYLLSFEGEGTIVSVKEEIKPDLSLMVYPNPTTDYCIVKGTVGARNVVVRNLLGSVLYARNIENNSGQIKIEMNGYDNGIYLISIVNSDRSVHTLKVIKR